MKGRSSAFGMWSSDHAMKLANIGNIGNIANIGNIGDIGKFGKRCNRLNVCGWMKRSSGPSARSPLSTRAPSAMASFCPSPVAVMLTPSTRASRGPIY
jgi:hypothetical protein